MVRKECSQSLMSKSPIAELLDYELSFKALLMYCVYMYTVYASCIPLI